MELKKLLALKRKMGFAGSPKKCRLLKQLGGGLILTAICFLVFSALTLGRGQLALARLEKSFLREPICHEECYFWRERQEKVILDRLNKESKRTAKRLFRYFNEPLPLESEKLSLDLAFKKELIKIMFLAYGSSNPPDYLSDYLDWPQANQDLVREIMTIFGPGLGTNRRLVLELDNKLKTGTSSEEKIAVLKTLREISNDAEIDSYFSLLTSTADRDLKREAVKNISAIREKSLFFTLEQLEVIKELVLSQETEVKLRQDLVLLLGDYYLVFPEASAKIWKEIYRDTSLDSVSRVFSADNLNHLARAKLTLPAVNPQEWEDYYND